MSIFDSITASEFRTQFPRFSPQYLSDITYVVNQTYFKNNVVYYETKFYKCKAVSTINPPTNTTDWELYDDSVLNYTQDKDILEAYDEAKVNFNESLFGSEEIALKVFLFLAAHYLTVDFMNAMGIGSIGIPTSKSVGSVSEGYSIPPWIQDNPGLSVYTTTGYGLKFCSLIRPYLVGNIMLFKGGTTVA